MYGENIIQGCFEQFGIFLEDDAHVYLLISAAQDKSLYARIKNYREGAICLFDTKTEALLAVAPYLIKITGRSPLAVWLIENGLKCYRSILFAASDDNVLTFKDHFQPFVRVLTYQEQEIVFRFYDPRILHTYFLQSTQFERQRFFGAIYCFWLRDPAVSTMMKYTLTTEGAMGEEQCSHSSIERNGGVNLEIPPVTIDEAEQRHHVILRKPILAAFEQTAMKQTILRLKKILRTYFSNECNQLGEVALDERIKRGVDTAKEYGLISEINVSKFISISFKFGEHFERRLQWAYAILNNTNEAGPTPTVNRLYSVAAQYELDGR